MIILIRHAKVIYKWKSKYTKIEFIKANKEYDSAEIKEIDSITINKIKSKIPDDFELYTSNLKRSINTANYIFPNKTALQLSELCEIAIEPYTNSTKNISLFNWFFFGRLQWLLNNPRQKRNKIKVNKEITRIINMIDINKNYVIIGHGFHFRILIKALIKESYIIKKSQKKINNLDVIECNRRGPTTASTG